MKTALITGVAGQDGSFMAEHLLSLGYRVVGTVRRSPQFVPWISPLLGKVECIYADMRDATSIEAAVNKSWPDEVYNFASYDGIPLSWNHPEDAMNVIYGGLSRLLSVLRAVKPDAKVYQASSAAMFGQADGACDENTKCNPDSPYAIAKHAAHELALLYRQRGQFVACGICMNHESERRFGDRASKKISTAVAQWSLGMEEPLAFGQQESKRDWGFAGDFVKAFHLMLQQDVPGDYVIGTGESRSVRDFIKACCWAGGLSTIPDHLIKTDERLIRKNDVRVMIANATKARTELNWSAETHMEQLAARMVETEINRLRRVHANDGRAVPA